MPLQKGVEVEHKQQTQHGGAAAGLDARATMCSPNQSSILERVEQNMLHHVYVTKVVADRLGV